MSRFIRWIPAGQLTVAAGLLLGLAPASPAADVKWRPDYAAARREATQRGLPLVVDFRSEKCLWCDKLEATTLRDPTIVAILNERFVPVKVNATFEPSIAKALNIELYPTVILADHEGKILGLLKGYMEPAEFYANVQKVLAQLPAPRPPQDNLVSTPKPANGQPAVATPTVEGPPKPNPAAAPGPDVQWRLDYNLARREAQEKSRPLVLEFAVEENLWCKKLDLSTFRDANVVRTMNEQFVPLKIDGDKDAGLAQSLRITKFPTIVLAAPDGRILAQFEGYLEAARFNEYMQRALASVSNPEWMQRDYQAAAKAFAANDYVRTIALLRSIIEDGNDRPVQIQARQLLRDLEQVAAGRLARAKMLDNKGQTTEAMETISELLRVFAGTQAAAEAAETFKDLAAKPEIKQQQRTTRARELLAQAREDYRTQQYLCCLDRCEVLAGNYGDLPEGVEAVSLASEVKNNPEWMRKACDDLSDRLGVLLLSRAETCLVKGQLTEATECLERVIRAFPGTRQSETAKVRLSHIQGQPNMQTDYSKPE